MIISKKRLPRRTFLRGLGVTVGLPLLDGMIPALATAADVVAKPVTRMSFMYVPNGIMNLNHEWSPATVGALEITPILEPLTAFRDHLLLLSGLSHPEGRPQPGESVAVNQILPGQEFICFEPMTAPTNALNSGDGLTVIAPGESYRAAFRIGLSRGA